MITIFKGYERRFGRVTESSGGSDRVFIQVDVDLKHHLKEFPGNTWKVLFCIALHINEEGFAYPSIALIQRECGEKTRASIFRALRSIRKIRIDGRPVLLWVTPRASAGKYGSNSYLVFPSAGEVAQFEADFGPIDESAADDLESPSVDFAHSATSSPSVDLRYSAEPHSVERDSAERDSGLRYSAGRSTANRIPKKNQSEEEPYLEEPKGDDGNITPASGVVGVGVGREGVSSESPPRPPRPPVGDPADFLVERYVQLHAAVYGVDSPPPPYPRLYRHSLKKLVEKWGPDECGRVLDAYFSPSAEDFYRTPRARHGLVFYLNQFERIKALSEGPVYGGGSKQRSASALSSGKAKPSAGGRPPGPGAAVRESAAEEGDRRARERAERILATPDELL